jgi:5'-nucleotidase
MIRATLLLLILIAPTLFATPLQKTTDDNFKLIILHNNDMHARFEQTNAASGRCKEDDALNNRCYGGFARVAHEVRRYKKKAEDGEIPPVLYLNAGDTYTGTPWFSIYKDNITAAFLNVLKPDAMVTKINS